MLHYPDSLLSSFFTNNPYLIGFISVLFNTLRETMQACGFAGAGKQVASPASETLTKIECPNTGAQLDATCKKVNGQAKWDDNPTPETQVDGVTAPTNISITFIVLLLVG